ncbi:helix-turn-helix domain-containing protein [Mycolicibacter arupensis]|uniref:Helix-turn-helix domain-containing protein n=1 Tax=Mycolicibacter arupensis TaxID=342002 RepID=A0A5C7Y296_9MYCO|nr:helix-turn-helix domain-containing protein [Mycolicibacter arupensis]TXI55927.1 MAG: hypothetical protein E6Q54_11920 [Mycolicibacter arupensis]
MQQTVDGLITAQQRVAALTADLDAAIRDRLAHLLALHSEGWSTRRIGAAAGISHTTVWHNLHQAQKED